MPAAARPLRAFVLIVTALMGTGGESLALPVAHLFADHHHEISLSPASGNWQWEASGDHHHESPISRVADQGHHHQIDAEAAQAQSGRTAGLNPAMSPVAVVDDHHGAGPPTRFARSHEPPPDVGKPDLALLATMRV